jgi:DNA-binding transcriptional ArsR family regulator
MAFKVDNPTGPFSKMIDKECPPGINELHMSRPQTESIREFILDRVADGPKSVARQVAQAYGISRQAANRHLDTLVEAGVLEEEGATRSREYRLRRMSLLNREVRVTPVLSADRLWDDHIAPVLASDRAAVRDLCRGAFGELIRNVIAHAQAQWIAVSFSATARHLDITVSDDGRGIFHRLAERVGLSDVHETAELMSRHANARSADFPAARLLLLARNFESFAISSSGVALAFDSMQDAWFLRDGDAPVPGTQVTLRLRRSQAAGGARDAATARRNVANG